MSISKTQTEYFNLLGSFSGQGEVSEAVHDGGRVRPRLVQHCIQVFLVEQHTYTACKKVLNSGLGPFKDQTAEMVLFWSFFYTKVLFSLL